MKLYVISEPEQAKKALEELRGKRAEYITTKMNAKGVIRWSKKANSYKIEGRRHSAIIYLANVSMIVHNPDIEVEVRILTNI